MTAQKLRTAFSLVILGSALFALPAQAARFANQFVEFELPPQWQCNLEGAEWVCQSTVAEKKRDAIIILAAKLKGDQDSLDQYLSYLKNPKNWTSIQGKPVKSEAKYAKNSTINNHPWIDSLHMESEIPLFYTRYLATIKQDIGVLVTFSVQKDKYASYNQDIENLVQTLRVFRKPGGINAAPANSNLFANTQIPSGMTESAVFPTTPQGGSDAPKKPKKSNDMNFYLIVGGVAIAAILLLRKMKKKS